ncbi:MAG TPA: BON domain-containing protein [Terriglobales bacterium]|jgi:hypothetical protein
MKLITLPVCAGTLVLSVAMAGCTHSNAGTADSGINAAVEQKLAADSALQGAKITASTQNGVVTLAGTVSNEAARVDAAKDAQVPGATQVNNEIGTDTAMAPAADTSMMAMRPAAAAEHRRADSASAVAAAPHMSAVAPVEVESGTALDVRLTQALNSATASAGGDFHGTLSNPVLVNGQVAIPRGADVTGTIVAADSAGHFKGQSRLELKLAAVSYNGQSYDLTSGALTRVAGSRSTRSAETIGGGAAVGALIGALAGHGKGAAIGALAGGGAGTAAQALTKPAEVELPAETVLKFTLSAPVQVVPAASVK